MAMSGGDTTGARGAVGMWRAADALLALAAVLMSAPAFAAPDEVDKNGAPVPSVSTSLPNPDPGGMRKWLSERAN